MIQLTPQLQLEHPIIQAPMAGVSTPALAAAVSQAGGLGSVATGASSVAEVAQMIAAVRAATDRPFNVNLFCHRPAVPDPPREARWLEHLRPFFAELGAEPPAELTDMYPSFVVNDELLELLLRTRPPVISFHFGLPPADKLAALRSTGATLLAGATTLAEARLAEAAGIDAVVAQGVEAGGHRGVFEPEHGDAGLGTLVLTRLLVRELTVPVIAAGGIMDGAGIAAVLRLGAVAAQLGTAFIACPESMAGDAHRALLLQKPPVPTALTEVVSGRMARGFVNRFVRDVDAPGRPAVAPYARAYSAARALVAAARQRGNADFAVQWAGQGAPLARALPAAELMRVLVAELVAA
ncbi:nitronate monooxygenase [Hymenobacter busanensis]|uniref:Nitronate monooxygenase n=1 Tax=Hymenobacter busanensis TaxID=2607656 RepID=A0A7L5A2N0_9BACT|nr:nitronate monooxygenase [Hymenobacter busanensis]KAA9338199.1 nitronate monooxygenase [Hymenobacter busanensis]QHJ09376.1 nitronate monooxygenase [Hymenobacter busanensis]